MPRTELAYAGLVGWVSALHFLSGTSFNDGIRVFWLLLSLITLTCGLRWLGRRARGRLRAGPLALATAVACAVCVYQLGLGLVEEVQAPNSQRWIFDIAANTSAAGDHFAAGRNPYAHRAQLNFEIAPKTPHVAIDHDKVVMFGVPYAYGYPYFPVMFLSFMPFRAAMSGFNTIRIGNAAFLALGALLVFVLARRISQLASHRNRAHHNAVGLIALAAYLLVSGWRRELFLFGVTDVAIATLALGGYLALTWQRAALAGMLFGLAQAAKLLPGPLFLVPLLLHLRGQRSFGRLLASYAVTTAALVLPFVLWDPAHFLSSTVLFYLTHHAAGDGTSLWFFLPAAWKTPFRIIGLVSTLLVAFRGRRAPPWDLSWPITVTFIAQVTFVATNVMSHLNYVWGVYPLGCLALASAVGAVPAASPTEGTRCGSAIPSARDRVRCAPETETCRSQESGN